MCGEKKKTCAGIYFKRIADPDKRQEIQMGGL